jgi:hypothetical protein
MSIFNNYTFNQFKKLSPNVPAVYDVFLRPIRKNAKHFFGRKKMWRSKTHKGRSPTGFCVARAAEGGEAYTDLLHDDFFTPIYNRLAPWTAQDVRIIFLQYILIHYFI